MSEQPSTTTAVAIKKRKLPRQPDAMLGMLERLARDSSVDISRVEKLMEMRKEFEMEQAKRAFLEALAIVQPLLPVIDRKGRIVIKEKGGEKILQSTKYALWEDINEAITPIISAEGLSLGFEPGTTTDGKITVTAILGHSAGYERRATVTLTHDSTGSKNAVQAVGSSMSYGKRYAAGMLLNITTRGQDDDGKAAGEVANAKISEEQRTSIQALIDETHADVVLLCRFYKIEALSDLPASLYGDTIARLEARKGAK